MNADGSDQTQLTFPDDPLSEDPQYVLTIKESERFADGVEKLFPEVNWDEPVPAELSSQLSAVSNQRAPRKQEKARPKRRK